MHAVESAGGLNRRRLSGLVAVAALVIALAIPALAAAHPQVYKLTPKKAPTGCTYTSDPTGACLENNVERYAVANDGFAMTYTENGEGSYGSVLNYQMMPTAFRASMTSEQKRTFALAQTPVQAHATCQGVAALESGANILAWQGADPFFSYVPWQKTTANLGDEPSSWIPVVQTAVGVDLSSLSTEAEFKSACEGKGGTYRKADSPSNPMGTAIAEAVEQAKAPLEDEVNGLLAEKSTLQGQINAWAAKGAALEAEKAALTGEKTTLTGEKTALEQQVGGLKKANTNKNKTIKQLRKQLKAAHNG